MATRAGLEKAVNLLSSHLEKLGERCGSAELACEDLDSALKAGDFLLRVEKADVDARLRALGIRQNSLTHVELDNLIRSGIEGLGAETD